MSTSFLRPYISSFAINLNAFVLKRSGLNSRGAPITEFGSKKPELTVTNTLYLGPPDDARNVGDVVYSFLETSQPKVANSHKGLPKMKDVLDPESDAVKAWIEAIEKAIDERFPEFSDTSDESKARGPKVSMRINRIEVIMPWGDAQASERVIKAYICLYEDDGFTRQLLDAGFVVAFAVKEYLQRIATQELGLQGEITPDGEAAIRSQLMIYDLATFFAEPGVVEGALALGQSFYSTLISNVFSYKDADLTTIMAGFVEAMQSIAGIEQPEEMTDSKPVE